MTRRRVRTKTPTAYDRLILQERAAALADWEKVWGNIALALSVEDCSQCLGIGRITNMFGTRVCPCVLRNVFRTCHARFRAIVGKDANECRITEQSLLGGTPHTWAMKDEEFAADFCLVARRNLDEDEHRLFRFYFLLGADWRACCRKLVMDRGKFFRAVYDLEVKLGRVFRELKPHALYPLDEYYTATHAKIAAETPRPKVIAHEKPIKAFNHPGNPKPRVRACGASCDLPIED